MIRPAILQTGGKTLPDAETPPLSMADDSCDDSVCLLTLCAILKKLSLNVCGRPSPSASARAESRDDNYNHDDNDSNNSD